MLFPYIYVTHPMENLQKYIDFIFFNIWCKSPTSGDFDVSLFIANPDLHEVMEEFLYSDAKNADFFYGNIEKIYYQFSILNTKQIRRLKWWYICNNSIDKLCENNPNIPSAPYSEIEHKFPHIAVDLKVFFMGIYDFDASAIKKTVGTLKEHYNSFISVNKSGVCPFCGIGRIKGKFHSKRDAYDHYLPKSKYPFNSANFRNLAPACSECNEDYKGAIDPVSTDLGRRKAFYPYGKSDYSIELEMDLNSSDIEKLTPSQITLKFGPTRLNKEIETWKAVYGIEERYKATICDGGDNSGKYWLMQMLDELDNYEITPDEYVNTLIKQTKCSPYTDSNFLKKPFFEACKSVGLFK